MNLQDELKDKCTSSKGKGMEAFLWNWQKVCSGKRPVILNLKFYQNQSLPRGLMGKRNHGTGCFKQFNNRAWSYQAVISSELSRI